MTLTELAELRRLRYERKWLIEQLAGAWNWTDSEVASRLRKDSDAALRAREAK